MAEVDAVVSQPKFVGNYSVYIFCVEEMKNADEERKKLNIHFILSSIETPENRQAILSAATSKVDELKGKEGEVQITHWLVNLKMSLKCKEAVVPPPPVKCVSTFYSSFLNYYNFTVQ